VRLNDWAGGVLRRRRLRQEEYVERKVIPVMALRALSP
jgi:hypothetical protein